MIRKAFTIIELLVVITIISLILTIMFPVLSIARNLAKTTICQSNLRQLVVGLTVYDTQHGSFPNGFDSQLTLTPPGGYVGYTKMDKVGWWWFHFIDLPGDEKRRASPLWCPIPNMANLCLKRNVLCGNYGVNQAICRSSKGSKSEMVGSPLSAKQITRPAETLLVLDAGYATISWWYASKSPPALANGNAGENFAYVPGLEEVNSSRRLRDGTSLDAVKGRHYKKFINTGFTDGHVERRHANALLVPDHADSFPLWSPSRN